MFQCLLETCERKFATAAERKRHLIDAHAFPKGFRFDSVHMRRHKGQVTVALTLLSTVERETHCRHCQCGMMAPRGLLPRMQGCLLQTSLNCLPMCRCGQRQSCVGIPPKLDVGMPRKQVRVRTTLRPLHRALQV